MAYTKCIATLCRDQIYIFIYLSTRVEGLSRGLVSAILVVNALSSIFDLVIVSRVSCLLISQQVQTRLEKKSHRKKLSFFLNFLSSCDRIPVVVVIDRAYENARRG